MSKSSNSVCVQTRCDVKGVVSLLRCLIGQQPGQGGGSTPLRYLGLCVRHAGYVYHNINVAELSMQLVWGGLLLALQVLPHYYLFGF